MRIFIIAMAVLYWAGASLATSIMIGPAQCPVGADLSLFAAGDAAAGDLNQWRQAAEGIQPVVDISVAESPQTDRIFARFRADPETGATLSRRASPCGQ